MQGLNNLVLPILEELNFSSYSPFPFVTGELEMLQACAMISW